jgi:hypothetical protein
MQFAKPKRFILVQDSVKEHYQVFMEVPASGSAFRNSSGNPKEIQILSLGLLV